MEFCARRFGKEFAERVMDHLVAGIYGSRVPELSVSALFPKLVALEEKYGSVTLGVMHRAREGGKMPESRLFSWRDGIATLPRTLAHRLRENIQTGVTVRRISPGPNGFDVHLEGRHRLQAKSVVVATEAHVAEQLIFEIDPQAATATEQIHSPPLAMVFLGFRRGQVAHPLDSLGFLKPEAENCNILSAATAPEPCSPASFKRNRRFASISPFVISIINSDRRAAPSASKFFAFSVFFDATRRFSPHQLLSYSIHRRLVIIGRENRYP